MEKFNSTELKVFNLIREGKSRDEIATSGITTLSNLNVILSAIYEKTNYLIGYHSARNKFKELQGYLRNNPNILTPIPDKVEENSDNTGDGIKKTSVHEIIKRLNAQYKQALEVNKAKLSVLDDIEKELTEGV